MKKVMSIISVQLFFATVINFQQSDYSKLTGPYLGQKPPVITPELLLQVLFRRIRISSTTPLWYLRTGNILSL